MRGGVGPTSSAARSFARASCRSRGPGRRMGRTAAALAVGTSNERDTESPGADGAMLEVRGLEAEISGQGKAVLKGVDLVVRKGEVHAIMGQNGSGKSTLTKVLVGHPDYDVTGGSVQYKGSDLLDLEPEERSHAGLFLSFQNPIELPGVNNTDFLRLACNARRKALGKPEMDPLEFYGYVAPLLQELKIDNRFLNRNVNEGFSGGERKRNEILQLAVLEAELAILDEIDSGLDIDAMKEVAAAVNVLKESSDGGMGVIVITHYQRLLDYIEPDFVHIMKDGKITMTGDKDLAKKLENICATLGM